MPLTSPDMNRSYAAFSVRRITAICSYHSSSRLAFTVTEASAETITARPCRRSVFRWDCDSRSVGSAPPTVQ